MLFDLTRIFEREMHAALCEKIHQDNDSSAVIDQTVFIHTYIIGH